MAGNTVLPGPVETEGAQSLPGWDRFLAKMVSQTALGRAAQPQDTAKVVTFLASGDAGWITGRLIRASGGLRP